MNESAQRPPRIHDQIDYRTRRLEAALSYYPRLSTTRQFVENNLSADLTLSLVADKVGMSASGFSHYFSSKTGLTFGEWLRLLRIRASIELLSHSDQTIVQVAHAVGFRSVRSFERAFKKITRITPRDFRSEARLRILTLS